MLSYLSIPLILLLVCKGVHWVDRGGGGGGGGGKKGAEGHTRPAMTLPLLPPCTPGLS